jgi:hypothetical protein
MSEAEHLILLERQAKRIKELEAENARLLEAIKKDCRKCAEYMAGREQCERCAFREFKEEARKG